MRFKVSQSTIQFLAEAWGPGMTEYGCKRQRENIHRSQLANTQRV